MTLIAGCVNEGIQGYRRPSMECAEELANNLGIEFKSLSYKSLGFDDMDNVVKKIPAISEKAEKLGECHLALFVEFLEARNK